MTDAAKEFWAEMPTYIKRGAFVAGFLLTFLGGGVAIAPIVSADSMASEVARNTAANARQDAQIDTIRAERREDRATLNFLACGQEQRIKAESEAGCMGYLTGMRR